jgi:hypothetical protein
MDTNEACERSGQMWLALAEQIAGAIPDIIITSDDPAKAIRWATCAEACFWKATGEADTHDVKDVLRVTPTNVDIVEDRAVT